MYIFVHINSSVTGWLRQCRLGFGKVEEKG